MTIRQRSAHLQSCLEARFDTHLQRLRRAQFRSHSERSDLLYQTSQMDQLILVRESKGNVHKHKQAVSMVTPSLVITQTCDARRLDLSHVAHVSTARLVSGTAAAPGINEGTAVTSRSRCVTAQRAGRTWHGAPGTGHRRGTPRGIA